MADRVSDSIEVAANAAELFEIATDFESYPQWQPNVRSVEVLERDDRGRATKVAYEVDIRVRRVRYTLVYDYADAPRSFSWRLAGGDLKALQGSYTFDERDGGSVVSYELEIDPGFPLPGLLKRQAARTIVATALGDLKKRAERS